MKNTGKILLIIFVIAAIVAIAFWFFGANSGQNQPEPQSSPGATQLKTEVNQVDVSHQNNRIEGLMQNRQTEEVKKPSETQLGTYTTKIGDDSPGRVMNIRITCTALHETLVKPGETFSFNKIVGEPTTAKGYQEAKVIINHETKKGIGGGNCQVSSTIYNAVLATTGLTVTERHEHGKEVGYVPDNKDAAVSYGSLDLKFRNDTGSTIRVDVATDNSSITATIFRLES